MMKKPEWLQWAQRLQAIAQNGLTYARDPFDVERFLQVRQIAAEMLASGSDTVKADELIKVFQRNFGYATPKVDVRAAVLRNDRLLLVRELDDGGWTLPGGWAEVGQSPAESVEREVREESGYIVKAVKLLACWDRNKHPHPSIPFHAYKLVFRCELLGGIPNTSSETTEVGFFAEDQIPALSVTRTLPEQIRFVFQSLRDPAAPAAFD